MQITLLILPVPGGGRGKVIVSMVICFCMALNGMGKLNPHLIASLGQRCPSEFAGAFLFIGRKFKTETTGGWRSRECLTS
jgi:hypothetical protein